MAYRDTSIEGRLLAGDEDAIGEISRWVARVVASLRFWRLRSEWLDLHQEVVTRVIASLRAGRFDDRQDLRTYVQAVARYTALEAINHQPPVSFVASLENTRSDDRENVERRVMARQLARLVFDHASDECRRLLRAYFYEQRSYSEIASEAGIPIGTVKSRLARCLDTLHRIIDPGSAARTRKSTESRGSTKKKS